MGADRIPPAEPTLPGVEDFLDESWYRNRYPDAADLPALEHFLRHGEAERRSPGPGFDAEFYAGTYLALEQTGALHHYLTKGRQIGHLPRPLPRTAGESRAVMADALGDRSAPILLLGNDAQRAGAPLLLLELARHLRRRGWSPVFLLQRAGPLLDRFRTIGPTLLVAEGLDLGGVAAALEPGMPVIANTGWAAPILAGLGHPGPAVLLIHEMPDYLEQQGLLPAVRSATSVVAGLPSVTEALTARLAPGTVVSTVIPGLLHAVGGPARVESARQEIDLAFGPDRFVVLGAGFADHRKGFDRFLALAHRLHAQEPRCAFVWLGDLSSWARGLADEALAGGLPLLLPGFRPDAAAWYDNTAVYLLTSRQDPGPTTVLDAARRGVPFVAAPGDLGLHSLRRLLTGVGRFSRDEEEVPAAVLTAARDSTPGGREARARSIETHAGFGRYVDDLLDLLRTQGLSREPPWPSVSQPRA